MLSPLEQLHRHRASDANEEERPRRMLDAGPPVCLAGEAPALPGPDAVLVADRAAAVEAILAYLREPTPGNAAAIVGPLDALSDTMGLAIKVLAPGSWLLRAVLIRDGAASRDDLDAWAVEAKRVAWRAAHVEEEAAPDTLDGDTEPMGASNG